MKHSKINIYLKYVTDRIKKKSNKIEPIIGNNLKVFCHQKVFDASKRFKIL